MSVDEAVEAVARFRRALDEFNAAVAAMTRAGASVKIQVNDPTSQMIMRIDLVDKFKFEIVDAYYSQRL